MKNTIGIIADKKTAWFKDWFDSYYYHKLYSHRDEKEAASFIDELLSELNPVSNASMLDLGCGAGRHAKYLASKGFDVTGTDLAFSSIKEAKRSETGNLRFLQRDMRMPFGINRYHIVFNFFTSFGYFETEDEHYRVINNIARSLKPGGVVVMDYINATAVEACLVPYETKKVENIVYNLSRRADNRFIYKNIIVNDPVNDDKLEYTEQVAKFNLYDFEDMFRYNGLKLQNVYGDYCLNSFEPLTSPRMILLAKKM